MNFDELSDTDIQTLLSLPKRVTNPGAKWKEKPGHRQKNFNISTDDYDFQVYVRQSLNDQDDFSCGLKVIKPDGQPLTLVRYNGPSHVHGDIEFQCHIHRATEHAIRAGRKPESEASATAKYRTLDGAIFELVNDCAISGIAGLGRDEPDLFGH